MEDIRKKSPLELDKLSIYTKPEKAEDRSARLIWSLVFNNPRITIFTNKKELTNKENDWGRITARLDPMIAFSILNQLADLVNKPNGTRFLIKNINYPVIDGKRAETPEHVNDVIIGKDQEGVIWLSIKEEGKPNIKFNITFSDYHEIVNGDGTPLTIEEASKLATIAYTSILKRMLIQSYYLPEQLEILNTTPEDRKTKYNTKGSYQRNVNKPSPTAATTADDFPF